LFMEGIMDIQELVNYLLTPVAQIALIVGVAEIVKRLGLEKRFVPVLDIVLGLTCGICVYTLSMGYPVYQGILIGLALGLSACGLFSGIKNFSEVSQDDYDEI